MEDFAALVIDARQRAGLTQAEVATAAGLTPSYLSFLENRRKPPPSDAICRRLAKVLKISEKRLLEVAHMERAPETVRRRVHALSDSLRRERRSRARALRSLLSPFLFGGPPGFLESAVDTLSISRARRRRIREVLSAIGRHEFDNERQVSRLVDALPERERSLLLEALPALLGRERAPSARRGEGTGREAAQCQAGSAVPPGEAPSTSSGERSGSGDALRGPSQETELRYAPLPAGSTSSAPYLLEVTRDVALTTTDLRDGDRILVDPAASPRPGDLVVLREETSFRLRRLTAEGSGFRLLPDAPLAEAARHPGPAGPPDLLDALALRRHLESRSAGVAVEVRRPLRGTRPQGWRGGRGTGR